jgi:hypothetical protein
MRRLRVPAAVDIRIPSRIGITAPILSSTCSYSLSYTARQPYSLASQVIGLLEDLQSPIPTDAVRVILNDRGRAVTAEHLGRLAAYEREMWLRTLSPPTLCSAIDTNAAAIKPRWWALGDWRLQRRIMTDDVRPIWFAALGERLCLELADRKDPAGSPLATLALSCAARVLGERYFNVPMSAEQWLDLRRTFYEPYNGDLNNRAGATQQQSEAETLLIDARLPAVDLYFGRTSGEATGDNRA